MKDSNQNSIIGEGIEDKKKAIVAGVQYRQAGKIYTFETNDCELARGDLVIVEAEQGTSMGTIVIPPHEVDYKDLPSKLKKIVRRASEEEKKEQLAKNEKALGFFELFCRKIKEQKLSMKPLGAELVDGDRKIIFTFFAEERVDFRQLVKELASELHMRIEMHQIGARDEIKYVGGIGTCGLVTCCFLHLRQFQSISVQMAKTQGLTPNPAKLTGICGKLKCCLAYENPIYAEIRQRLPKVGMLVSTPKGDGKIIDLDVLSEMCTVRVEDGLEVRVSAKDIRPQKEKIKKVNVGSAISVSEEIPEEKKDSKEKKEKKKKVSTKQK